MLNARDISILYLPQNQDEIEKFCDYFSSADIKINIALQKKFELTEKINNLVKENKINILMTLENYPYVSLIYYPSYSDNKFLKELNDSFYFLSYRLYYEKDVFDKKFKNNGGIFLPYGDLNINEIKMLKSLNYKWSPVYSSEYKNTVLDFEGYKLIPFKLYVSSFDVLNSSDTFYMIDNSINSSTEVLNSLYDLSRSTDLNFKLADEFISVSTPVEISSFTAFAPYLKYEDYLQKEEQYILIKRLSNLKKDISMYLDLNGNKNQIEIMEKYIDLEKDIFEISKTSENISDLEIEISNNLVELYRMMNMQVPQFAYNPFTKSTTNTYYKFESSTDSLSLINSDMEKAISTFSVTDNASVLSFDLIFSTAQSVNFDIAIYIDINSIMSSGNNNFLKDLKEKIEPKSAWEYAIVLDKDYAYLYRYAYYNLIKVKQARLKKEGNKISFDIDRSTLSGNFLKWKYIVILSKDGKIIDGTYREINENGIVYPF